ncbi:hypothetical protein QE449_000879 [Rhodococcus sp. SORGH_AS303]|nr:hypothetical protein [Rhodococcus sp. SORGH_AS_0303]
MHHDGQHVVGLADLEQATDQRDVLRDLEGGHREGDQHAVQIPRVDRHGCQVRHHGLGIVDDLDRSVLGVRVGRPQRLVAVDDVHDRDLQRGDVQITLEAQGQRDVVGDRRRVELIEEPHAALRERQRHRPGPLAGHQRRAGLAAATLLQSGRERLDGGCLEQRAHRDLCPQCGTQTGDGARRDERVAAESEEVVVESDPVDTHQLREDGCHDLLDHGGRGAELARREHRLGQPPVVDLAVDGDGQAVQDHDGGRDHVRRKMLRGMA